jgi:taurine dioxygenase
MGTATIDSPAPRIIDPVQGLQRPTSPVALDGSISAGPIEQLRAERERLLGLRWEHFSVKPLGATIGAELHGISLADELSDAAVAEVRQALLDYKVIFFREQHLTAAQHVAFAQRFGELEVHPFIPANAEHPELVRFEKSAELGGYENFWHSDVSWRETPSMGAVLRAVRVPPSGGDTVFADMYAAYESLSDELRERVEGLRAVHDFTRAFGRNLDAASLAKMQAQYPAVEHPVVRTHPETGRKLLYVNGVFVRELVGVDPAEGAELLSMLYRYAAVLEFSCRFHWEPGSIAFWDNRAVQHYACSDYWPAVRIMERASIIGDRPT